MAALSTTTQPARKSKVRLYAKHSLLARTLHWLNLVAIGALVATGILILRSPAPLANLPHELFIAVSIHQVFEPSAIPANPQRSDWRRSNPQRSSQHG